MMYDSSYLSTSKSNILKLYKASTLLLKRTGFYDVGEEIIVRNLKVVNSSPQRALSFLLSASKMQHIRSLARKHA